MTDKKNKCVFFDRDNTLIYDKGYIFKKKDLKWKSGVIRTIKLLNKLKFLVIVITNQSGVARKYFTENDVINFHIHMNKKLKLRNALINDFFYCPFYKYGFGKYKKNSIDRKPNNGMLKKAIKKWNVDINKSYFVGDSLSDFKAAKKTKIRFIKVPKKNLYYKMKNIFKN
jgi:D-glycero-D-manno-heptose 1,7-bisphosphate phosphatase